MSVLARPSLRNRGLTVAVALVAVVAGLVAVPRLRWQLLPVPDLPVVLVTATAPGAAPDTIDRQVTMPIVTAVRGVPGVKLVTSTSREGLATVQVEFEHGAGYDRAVSAVNSALERARPQLPAGAAPGVSADAAPDAIAGVAAGVSVDVAPGALAGSVTDLPSVMLAASTTGDEATLAERLRTVAVPQIMAIGGVREVTVTGARDRCVLVTPDPRRLAVAGVDLSAVRAALRSNGVTIPAGVVAAGGGSLAVQVGSPMATLDDVRGLPLGVGTVPAGAQGRGGGAVRLGDVADISEQLAPPTSIVRTDGRPGIGVSVTAAAGGDAVRLSEQLREALPEIRSALGGDVQLTVVFDQAPLVERSVGGMIRDGLLGLALALVVILVALLSIRSVIVAAAVALLSVLIVLLAFRAGDVSLNVLTLGALTIAVGRVTGDSTLVLESVERHQARWPTAGDRHGVVLVAVREVAGTLTAAAATTAAALAPIALVGGVVGDLLVPFAVTIAVALGASLLVSLTVVPVLAYRAVAPGGRGSGGLLHRGGSAVRRAIRRRSIAAVAAAAVVVGTGALAAGIKTNVFGDPGWHTLTVVQQLPAGSSLATTDAAAGRVEKILAATPGVRAYQVAIGGGRAATTDRATFLVTVRDDADPAAVSARLRQQIAGLTDAGEVRVSGGGGLTAGTARVVVRADDEAVLAAASERVRTAMATVGGITDVGGEPVTGAPRVEVTLDRAAAGRYGLTDATVGQSVAAALHGGRLGQLTIGGHQRAVVLRFDRTPSDVEQLRALPLATPDGPVALEQVARVRQVVGPGQITRTDGSRSVTVSGVVTGGDLAAVTRNLVAVLGTLDLSGATYTVAGVGSDQRDAFTDLGLALLAAIVAGYIVMAVAFGSLVRPLLPLLVSVPPAAVGAVALLSVTGTALGVPALVGMLTLVGLVLANAVVLTAPAGTGWAGTGWAGGLRTAGAGGGRSGLRPMLVTAASTVCALLPAAFAPLAGGDFVVRPLAIVVVGGLVASTVLTAAVLPARCSPGERRSGR